MVQNASGQMVHACVALAISGTHASQMLLANCAAAVRPLLVLCRSQVSVKLSGCPSMLFIITGGNANLTLACTCEVSRADNLQSTAPSTMSQHKTSGVKITSSPLTMTPIQSAHLRQLACCLTLATIMRITNLCPHHIASPATTQRWYKFESSTGPSLSPLRTGSSMMSATATYKQRYRLSGVSEGHQHV